MWVLNNRDDTYIGEEALLPISWINRWVSINHEYTAQTTFTYGHFPPHWMAHLTPIMSTQCTTHSFTHTVNMYNMYIMLIHVRHCTVYIHNINIQYITYTFTYMHMYVHMILYNTYVYVHFFTHSTPHLHNRTRCTPLPPVHTSPTRESTYYSDSAWYLCCMYWTRISSPLVSSLRNWLTHGNPLVRREVARPWRFLTKSGSRAFLRIFYIILKKKTIFRITTQLDLHNIIFEYCNICTK